MKAVPYLKAPSSSGIFEGCSIIKGIVFTIFGDAIDESSLFKGKIIEGNVVNGNIIGELFVEVLFEKTDYCSWKLFIETMLAGLKKWGIG